MRLSQKIGRLATIFTYSLAFCLLLPALLLKLKASGNQVAMRGRWREYFGFVPPVAVSGAVWIHAASVGEVMVSKPLIHKLKSANPAISIILTTTTQTGAKQAEALGDGVTHYFAPFDCAWMVRLFLNRVKPHSLLIIETERWLHYMRVCQQQGIPVVVVNGRLSPRSFRRYQTFPAFFRLWAEPVGKLLVQHDEDAERFRQLGVAPEKLVVTGSIKFDLDYPVSVSQAGAVLRQAFGDRPVWIAASTHKGEDEQVLDAFRQILDRLPDTLLILVPRHPQRFDNVLQLCVAEDFAVVRRSSGGEVSSATQIYLGDTMGELPIMLAAADLAFVGGSLVNIGGHNLLEPAALGKASLTGPAYFNFADITRQLMEKGGARVVRNAEELATTVLELLQDDAQRQGMGKAARQVVSANRGALQKTLQELEPFLP